MKTKNKIFIKGEINISNLFSLILFNIKKILITIILFFIIALLYIIIQTPLYKSTMDFNPSTSDSSSDISSFIDGVVSSYGVNIDNSTTLNFYIPDVVDSRSLKKKVVLTEYQTLDNKNINLIEFWEIDRTNFIKRSIKTIKSTVYVKILGHVKSDVKSQQINQAIEELTDRIVVNVNDHGKITIDVWMEEPELANKVNSTIYQAIIDYSKKIHNDYTKMNVSFVKSRLNEQEIVKNEAQKLLTEWLAKNKNFQSSPQLLGEYEILQSEALIEREVYITLKQQYELAEIEAKKNKPPVFELDPPKNNTNKPLSPNIYLIIPLFILTGFVLSLFRIIYINELK